LGSGFQDTKKFLFEDGTVLESFVCIKHLKYYLMELKKTNRAKLENRKTVNFLIGMIISLSLILISFEWTTMTSRLANVNRATEISPDLISLPPIPREETRPPAKPKTPPISMVLKLLDEDPELPPIFWDPEVLPGTEIFIPPYTSDERENLPPEDVYIAQIMPQFNGGEATVEFSKYIYGQLEYPAEAVENGVSGRVLVKFVVNSKGYIERVEILQGVHPSLDQEAMRVIKASPRWEPGVQNGRYVNVIYTFPIKFFLQ
jgi:protein TonB